MIEVRDLTKTFRQRVRGELRGADERPLDGLERHVRGLERRVRDLSLLQRDADERAVRPLVRTGVHG